MTKKTKQTHSPELVKRLHTKLKEKQLSKEKELSDKEIKRKIRKQKTKSKESSNSPSATKSFAQNKDKAAHPSNQTRATDTFGDDTNLSRHQDKTTNQEPFLADASPIKQRSDISTSETSSSNLQELLEETSFHQTSDQSNEKSEPFLTEIPPIETWRDETQYIEEAAAAPFFNKNSSQDDLGPTADLSFDPSSSQLEDSRQEISALDISATTEVREEVSAQEDEKLTEDRRRKSAYSKLIAKARGADVGRSAYTVKNGRNVARSFPIIQEGSNEFTLFYSGKGAGFDENFKISKKSSFKTADQKLGLTTNQEPSFTKAFEKSRVRTHEYVHAAIDKNSKTMETTGHPGGLLNEYPVSSSKSWKNSGSPQFHAKRQEEIEAVIKEGHELKKEIAALEQKIKLQNASDEEKKRKTELEAELANIPTKAVVKALTFVVQNTLGIKDLTRATDIEAEQEEQKQSKISFKGFTASGLDLSDPEQRKYAFKTYQAVRDKLKLTALKFSQNLNEQEYTEEVIKRINDELAKEENGRMSPLRSGTPYCDANNESIVKELAQAKSFDKINEVAAKATPCLTPQKKGFVGGKIEAVKLTEQEESKGAKR